MTERTRGIPPVFLAFAAGIGVLVAADLYLADIVSKQLGLVIAGVNLLKLFPYELTCLAVAAVLVSPLVRRIGSIIVANPDKTFLVLFFITIQASALTAMGRLDGNEILLMIYALFVLGRAFLREGDIRFTTLDLLNILFLGVVLLSTAAATVVIFISSFVTVTKFILIGFLFANTIRSKEMFLFAIKWLVIVTVASSVIALGQEILFLTTGIPLVGIVQREARAFMMEPTPIGLFLRVPAFCGSYKLFSFFLNTTILILLNYLLSRPQLRRRNWILVIAAFAVVCTALVLTFSKDAYLSLGVCAILSVLVWKPRYLLHATVAGILAVGAVTAGGYWDDIGGMINSELRWGEQRSRLELAEQGIEGFVHKRPVLGTGPMLGRRYTGHFFGWSAHNAFIQAADETGIVGVSVYLALILYSLWNIVRICVYGQGFFEPWLIRGVFAAFLSFLISIQFHPFFFEKTTWFYLGIAQAGKDILLRSVQDRRHAV